MKTSELTGAALDWAVAKAKGWVTYLTDSIERGEWYHTNAVIAPLGYAHNRIHKDTFLPSTDWAQGGPIIESEGINLFQRRGLATKAGNPWLAYNEKQLEAAGPTPLIAAMRCYVASKLGDDVEIPKELIT